MGKLQSVIAAFLLLSSLTLYGQDTSAVSSPVADTEVMSTTQSEYLYSRVLRTALKDGIISDEESALLGSLKKELQLSEAEAQQILNDVLSLLPKRLDQSGRWPLVLQNIGWGSGLYGWGIPYVLGLDDEKIVVGMEMMSFAGAFYLTHKYTENMDIPHSRAQMMRTGSGIGFTVGWNINNLFDIWDDDNKEAITILMLSVPGGILAGDHYYRKWEPSNGQAWSLTVWGGISWFALSQIHNIFEERPDPYAYNTNEEYEKQWLKRQALVNIIAYPTGVWAGHHFFGDRNYSFGDALMIGQSSGYGMFTGMMVNDLLGWSFDGNGPRVLTTLGAVGGPILMDRYIRGYDYSFGNAFLMAMGTGSGLLFNLGIGAMFDINDSKAMDILALSGGAAGFYLTGKIVVPDREESETASDAEPVISLTPILMSNFNQPPDSRNHYTPGIQLDLRF